MTSRERLISTLNHQEPDHLCVDFGAGFQTGLGAGISLDRNGLVGVNESVPRWIVKSKTITGSATRPRDN